MASSGGLGSGGGGGVGGFRFGANSNDTMTIAAKANNVTGRRKFNVVRAVGRCVYSLTDFLMFVHLASSDPAFRAPSWMVAL